MIMRFFVLFLIVALIALSVPSFSAEDGVSDDQIYDQVRRKLATDREVKGGGLDVEVRQGVVTMRGKVRTDKQKTKAEKIAKKVKGVTKVVNELVVEPY
jgi:osmotically-inducible protein OsmY